MELIKTKKDVSVWIIALYLLSVNLISWYIFGRELGLIFGNMFGLSTVALFVFWVKSNPKIDKWLETNLK